ncbi:hypothetical protein OG905_02050 [Streptomyces sp. NBC_00322]|uniref:hypothetical protein n=1 Tax=Streptomyces sp. NBC_00322 TaxID=2975712 RepID=UPI002E28B2C3|nr:hypothetical protein [Streptomyces sp. NBC_00322]
MRTTATAKSIDTHSHTGPLTPISYGPGGSLQILMTACSLIAALLPLPMRL